MSIIRNPKIITSGLIFAIDATDKSSYSGTGTTWSNIANPGKYDCYFAGTLPTYTASAITASLTTDFARTTPYSQSYFNIQSDSTLNGLLYQDHAIEVYMNPLNLTVPYDVDNSLTNETLAGILTWQGYTSGLFIQSSSNAYDMNYVIWNSSASVDGAGFSLLTYKNKNIHFVATRSGNNFYVYVNGNLSATKLNFTTSAYPYTNVRIGSCSDQTPFVNGFTGASNISYYAMRIYNRTLSENEIKNNYNTMKKRFGV
jgi:hypothetical protein